MLEYQRAKSNTQAVARRRAVALGETPCGYAHSLHGHSRGARGILSGTSLTEGGKDSKTGRDSGNRSAARVPRGALLVGIRDLQQQPIVKRLTGLPV